MSFERGICITIGVFCGLMINDYKYNNVKNEYLNQRDDCLNKINDFKYKNMINKSYEKENNNYKKFVEYKQLTNEFNKYVEMKYK